MTSLREPAAPETENVPNARLTRDDLLQDRQGKTFADVVNDSEQPFDVVLDFLNDAGRQRRMEESELHHDRAPLAGVVRELESLPAIDSFLAENRAHRNTRFRQAVGVLVRMIMERRGWCKTGRKGSLGVRAARTPGAPAHNSGGLAFWFVRAERYELAEGMPFQSVRDRSRGFEASNVSSPSSRSRRTRSRRTTERKS